MSLIFYTCDLETNGLMKSYHEVTQISFVRHSDKVQLTRNVKCDHPERSSADALKITGKTLADLKIGDDKIDVVNACNDFFAKDGGTPMHRVIVGHNILGFDCKFLQALWEEVGMQFPASLYLDTMQMIRQYIKIAGIEDAKVNLASSCDLLGIKKVAGAHNAKSDSRNTFLLFKKLVDEKKINYLPLIKTIPHDIKLQNK